MRVNVCKNDDPACYKSGDKRKDDRNNSAYKHIALQVVAFGITLRKTHHIRLKQSAENGGGQGVDKRNYARFERRGSNGASEYLNDEYIRDKHRNSANKQRLFVAEPRRSRLFTWNVVFHTHLSSPNVAEDISSL